MMVLRASGTVLRAREVRSEHVGAAIVVGVNVVATQGEPQAVGELKHQLAAHADAVVAVGPGVVEDVLDVSPVVAVDRREGEADLVGNRAADAGVGLVLAVVEVGNRAFAITYNPSVLYTSC
jgi:hypothetical protein